MLFFALLFAMQVSQLDTQMPPSRAFRQDQLVTIIKAIVMKLRLQRVRTRWKKNVDGLGVIMLIVDIDL